MYYKTKLSVNNFTIFDQATTDVCCYLWDETNGGLKSTMTYLPTLLVCYYDFRLSKF